MCLYPCLSVPLIVYWIQPFVWEVRSTALKENTSGLATNMELEAMAPTITKSQLPFWPCLFYFNTFLYSILISCLHSVKLPPQFAKVLQKLVLLSLLLMYILFSHRFFFIVNDPQPRFPQNTVNGSPSFNHILHKPLLDT